MKLIIYYLHKDPIECAKLYSDEDVRNVAFQLCVFLSLLRRTYQVNINEPKLYKLEMEWDHYAKWLNTNETSYKWVVSLFKALLDEYEFRFEKKHPSSMHKNSFDVPPSHLPGATNKGKFKGPSVHVVLPRKYQLDDNNKLLKGFDKKVAPLNSYKAFYQNEKLSTASYTKRDKPNFAFKETALDPGIAIGGYGGHEETVPRAQRRYTRANPYRYPTTRPTRAVQTMDGEPIFRTR